MTFSEILGLMEKKFEIKMFVVFQFVSILGRDFEKLKQNIEEISFQICRKLTYLKILFTVLIGQNLPCISAPALLNSLNTLKKSEKMLGKASKFVFFLLV